MTHPRQSIRDSVVALLKTGTIAETVADSRPFPFREGQQPALRVTTPDDEAMDYRSLAPSVIERRVTVQIEAFYRDNSQRADSLDDLCREVEVLMDNYPDLSGAATRVTYRDTATEISVDVDPPVSVATISYDVFYIDNLE